MHSATFATMATKLVSLGAAAAMVALGMATAAPPVRPVPHVDMQRYAGMWYEVALSEPIVERRAPAKPTAALPEATSIPADAWLPEPGTSRLQPVGPGHSARLKLSYQPRWLQWLPASSIDYWVVMLDPDYRYAVVSEPSRGSLWILSRTPTMDSAMYDGIVARLRAQRYPVDELVPTPQLQPLRHPPVVAARPRLMV